MFCKEFIQGLIDTEKAVKNTVRDSKNITITKHFTHLILKCNTVAKRV